ETMAGSGAEREGENLAGDGQRGLPRAFGDSEHDVRSAEQPENSAGLIHDARNMVTAIELYCDLLEEPGVLADPFRHYAGELRTVSAASRRLLDRLAGMERSAGTDGVGRRVEEDRAWGVT